MGLVQLYKSVDLSRDTRMLSYQKRITALLLKPWSLDKDGSLQLATLTLAPEARQSWIDIHNTIECQSGEFGDLAAVQSFAGKAAANVLRIGGVLATFEGDSILTETHVQRASTLMDYYLSEIQRLTEQEPITRLREEADRLLRWLRVKSWTKFSLRELNRNGPRFARKSSRHTAELLAELIVTHWVSSTDGRFFEVHHVSPQ